MKRTRHTPEQIIRKLREADAQLASGTSIAEVCKQLGVSETTYHRWRNQYGGMKAPEAKRLRELEKENARLKRLVADQALDISILKEVARGNFWARPGGGLPCVMYSGSWASPSVGRAEPWGRRDRASAFSRRSPGEIKC